MNRFILMLALALVMTLAACGEQSVREEYDASGKVVAREFAGGNPDYAVYAATQGAPQASVAIDATACNGDARCVENLSHDATIQALVANQRPGIVPPAPRRTFGDRVESVAKSFIGVTPALGGVYSGIKASDNARDISMAQYGFLGGVVHDVTTASAVVAQSGPSINVGGNYGDTAIDNSTHGDTISDSGNVSDSYNTPTEIAVSGDGSVVGDGNSVNNGDNNDNSGDLRDESSGPIDDHGNPGDCDGGGDCLPVVEPEG